MRRAQALLFDLDGTLLDSMPHHHDAWVEWYARRGMKVDVAGFFASTAGRSNPEILADLFPALSSAEHLAIANEKEAIYRQRAARSLGLIPGAQRFVSAARDAGFGLAICTASTPENLALACAMHGIDTWVQTVVSASDRACAPAPGTDPALGRSEPGISPAQGLRGKPHPDIFIEAARRLGVAPAECIVFEDAPLGVEAARRAGMRAVALTTTLPASAFAPYSNVIAVHADFTRLDPNNVTALSAPTKEENHA